MAGRIASPLAGKTFGRLVVLSRVPNDARNKPLWLCNCECGNQKIVSSGDLVHGSTKSCGCLARESSPKNFPSRWTHGASRTNEYRIWIGMRRRCSNPSNNRYKNYGGKGIKVCARWENSFTNFLADVGPRPSKLHSLDRKDSAGDYGPGNCVWTDTITQNNNRTNNHIVTYRGEQLTVANAWRRAGSIVKESTARTRLRQGWTVEAAVETPA